MKAIIDANTYDTATAEPVSEWRETEGSIVFDTHRERWFRSVEGDLFLATEGVAVLNAEEAANSGERGPARAAAPDATRKIR